MLKGPKQPDRVSRPWAVRLIVAGAIVLLVALVVFALATGTLFETPLRGR